MNHRDIGISGSPNGRLNRRFRCQKGRLSHRATSRPKLSVDIDGTRVLQDGYQLNRPFRYEKSRLRAISSWPRSCSSFRINNIRRSDPKIDRGGPTRKLQISVWKYGCILDERRKPRSLQGRNSIGAVFRQNSRVWRYPSCGGTQVM